MNALRHVVVAVLVCLCVAGVAESRTVYLKDGALLRAESVTRADGNVVVLVNHEEELVFPEEEINLQKTFPKPVVRKKTATAQKQAATAAIQKSMSSAKARPAGQSAPAAKSVPQTPAPGSGGTPTAAPATVKPAAPVTAAPSKPVSPPAPPAATVPPPPVPPPPAAKAPPIKYPLPVAATPAKNVPDLSSTTFIAAAIGSLLLFILMIASFWTVYEKAGEAGWKSLVPIYNVIVLLNIIDKPVWWIALLFIPVVNIIVTFAMYIELARRFGKGLLFGVGLVLVPIIFLPLLAFGDATFE